ncbi:cytochrome P450 [Streptomyces sp. NBC_00239]|uniref:cytochrome P450 n=1 Tax=Streptomyces sp. NBC_00239 TaxID=2903640 RepID=UPI002E2A2A43|nr:cytochrome P450 [Streptomyces sp. NBC_00239]
MPPHTIAPSSSISLFDERVLADPYPTYAALRATGPAVHLERHGVWAVPGYAEVQAVLQDPDTFTSMGGVALTEQANTGFLADSVVSRDGEEHARLRQALARRMGPRAISKLREELSARARRLVAEHAESGSFDAVALSRQMVCDTIGHLVGLAEPEHTTLLGGTFDVFGPDNDRLSQALPEAAAMRAALVRAISRDAVDPGSLAGAAYAAADRGRLTEAEAVGLVCDYAAASVDTTVFGLAETIARLAMDPVQWTRLRKDPNRAEAAFHEALRLDAPIQGRGRIVSRTTDLSGVRIEAGEHVWLLYGSTGRDERKWSRAETYDLARPFVDRHLALGAGAHQCPGVSLALMQARCLLRALAHRCTHLELVGDPVRALHNTVRGHSSVPVAVETSPYAGDATAPGATLRRPR